MKYIASFISITLLMISSVGAEIQTEELNYRQGEVSLKGYLAFDNSIEGQRPGILVVHEWWGHNPYARKRAEMLAKLGYTAMAVDMYGDGKLADHPSTAGEFSSAVMQDIAGIGKARFLAALDELKQHHTTDSNNIAAIGYCFGGGTVLHMARLGVDLKGVVSFHGSLASKVAAQPGDVKADVLVCNGANDSFVTPEHIAAFKAEMEELAVNYEFKNYEGAVHSFTNPDADQFGEKFGIPLAYNKEADQKSWQDMQDFFNRIFK